MGTHEPEDHEVRAEVEGEAGHGPRALPLLVSEGGVSRISWANVKHMNGN